jgi:methionyl-tRNA synthetase
MGKYYISTAIAYASSKPHIGNVYEIILADSIARFKRLLGYDVYFQTGTDEHGQKIEDKAKALNVDPKKYVDEISDQVKKEWDVVNISYDNFIRTTDPIHKEKVQRIFKKLYDQDDIYLGNYEGLYCVPCESFYTESQLIDGKCPDCHHEVQKASEDAYFLRTSKYADKLIKYIENHPEFLQPESRKNEMINNFLKPGLQDLCVSRTSFKWGVPVSFDDKHIIYVWIDALSNYITFLGYDVDGKSSEEYKNYWPADLHLIGKDIMRFHAIYWPIILMALGEELPKTIFGHPWILSSGEKMSKSKGNVLYTSDLAKFFGVDAVRFYALYGIPFANDGNISYELLIEKTNTELANTLGNLVNRTISMINQYFDGQIYEPAKKEEIDNDLINMAIDLPNKVKTNMDELQVALAIDNIFDLFRRANKYIEETTPWILAKDPNQNLRLQTVLYNLIEAIRCGTVLLQPFLPETAERIFEQLNVNEKGWQSLSNFDTNKFKEKVNKPEPLFIRINKEDKMKEISEYLN